MSITKKHLIISATSLILGATTANIANAGTKWQGRCHSRITGTDLGYVYASTRAGLTAACAKIANEPVVDNYGQVPCIASDPICVSAESSIQKCAGQFTTAVGHGSATINPHSSGRVCAVIPAGSQVTTSTCAMGKDGSPGATWCSYSTRSDGCAEGYIISQSFTEDTMDNGSRIICWGVYNESDWWRYGDLWIK